MSCEVLFCDDEVGAVQRMPPASFDTVQMYLAGVSVWRGEDITEALWGMRVSPSAVSELNQKVYGQIEA